MTTTTWIRGAGFAFVIGLIALLYWLTLDDSQDDPCARPQSDVTGAVLAEGEGDQDAMVNRAIIMKANCPEQEP